jgi:hypothetical protein
MNGTKVNYLEKAILSINKNPRGTLKTTRAATFVAAR